MYKIWEARKSEALARSWRWHSFLALLERQQPLGDAPEPFASKISFDSPNSPVGISPILQMSHELGVTHNSLAAVLMRRAEGRETHTNPYSLLPPELAGWSVRARKAREEEGMSQAILFIDPKRKQTLPYSTSVVPNL